MSINATKRRAGRPTAEEAEQKRKGLMIAALDEFARKGFHGASLRDIAEAAEVSSRTLYNYFPDKLTLFEACLEHSGQEIRPILPDLKGDLYERLVAYAIEMQQQLFSPQALQISALINREGSAFDELRQIARIQFERHQVAPVAAILESYDFAADECRALATQFVVMAFGEWQRRLLFGGKKMTRAEMSEHARLVADIFLNGVSVRRKDASAPVES